MSADQPRPSAPVQEYGMADAYRTFDEAWRSMRAAVQALEGRVVWVQRPQVRRSSRWFGWDGFAHSDQQGAS